MSTTTRSHPTSWVVYQTFTASTTANGSTIYRSYGTPVAIDHSNGQRVRTSEKYSVTTSKHLNRFCPKDTYREICPAEFADLLKSA